MISRCLIFFNICEESIFINILLKLTNKNNIIINIRLVNCGKCIILPNINLYTIFKGFLKLLTKQGKLIIQLLNYSKILAEKERVVSINKNKNQVYIRFYDFMDSFIRFNVLRINWKNQRPQYCLTSSHLYPYIFSDLHILLSKTNFLTISTFGNMKFALFDENESQNLVMVCEKA